MTALLASVMSAVEAELVLSAGADIIDLKDPRAGALGALPTEVIAATLARVAGRRPVSATIGDLPMVPDRVAGAVARVGELGVDFIKIGLFAGGNLPGCLEALEDEASRGLRLVAVMFADQTPDFTLIENLAARGFVGVMLDTADKETGGLRDHLDEAALRSFLDMARSSGLFAGLAGSLALFDVPPLLRLGPDYLGFRGALTGGGREAALDPSAVGALRRSIPATEPSHSPARAIKARAAAGAEQAAASRADSLPSTSVPKSL